jgi:Trk K+ transport system NAD-binding subunit
VPAVAVGRPLRELDLDGSVRVVAVRRLGVATLPTNDLVAQEGDVLYLAVSADRLADGGVDA